ncbi:uncharacterized protein LOC115215227 isoform X2 [Octopus sinensis]|uniref:Uncharacterized protein LOC115215227 isoform X2 n=1 Tax=Octopus sinensis TaxID=2607531 RepID=A0A6P7SQW3_9MOLL|nr:uncharacterized protein LOC115215227 isoform X2 [Octopus sinensis]XP_029640311.1 uncharacterized protein LOC115215227 isoform X2 [Octopus sinensis]XP_036361200.1 uncharacterized protein LOC115215227 isoform X2 [Octopus sinensis]XP_036361201.1 uncharacterized protein LOC115215227 isoform X2 [Octopus sinensis]
MSNNYGFVPSLAIMGNKVDKDPASEGINDECSNNCKETFAATKSTDGDETPTATEVKLGENTLQPVVHKETECDIDDDFDSGEDVFYDAEEADKSQLAYVDSNAEAEEEEEEDEEEEDEDGDDEDTSSSSHELLAETLRSIRERKLLKTKQIEIKHLNLLNTSWVDGSTQTDASLETSQHSADCVPVEVLANLIAQVEELLSHISDGGQDYQSALSLTLRLQLQNMASPALLANADSSNTLKQLRRKSEEVEQAKSFDTEGSMESYDITWDVGNSEWDPIKKQHTLLSPMTAESSEYSFLNDDNSLSQIINLRKNLDIKRWYCMSRPQYPSSAGISALVSCWNYLYSTLGQGNRDPVSQEVALTILGYQPPFSEIDSQDIVTNQGLIKSFQKLNEHFEVAGRGGVFLKLQGADATNLKEDYALALLKKGLKSKQTAYIYHCEKHFLCPIGYENTPLRATDAYSSDLCSGDLETWIILGDTSSKYPSLQCKKWDHILTDLNCKAPDFLDIRRLERGIRQRKNLQKLFDSNDHCILTFQKCQNDQEMVAEDADDDDDGDEEEEEEEEEYDESPPQEIIGLSDDDEEDEEEDEQCLLTTTRPPKESQDGDRLEKEEEELLEGDMDADEDYDNIL